MIWIILCKDKENAYEKRMSVIEEHRNYLSTNPIKTLLSEPMMDKNNNMMNDFFLKLKLKQKKKFMNFKRMIQYIKQVFGKKLSYHHLIRG